MVIYEYRLIHEWVLETAQKGLEFSGKVVLNSNFLNWNSYPLWSNVTCSDGPSLTVCVCVCVCVCARTRAQSCLTLCNPMDSSLPASSVHGILQARILERVAISSSKGSSWPRDWTFISCISCIDEQIFYHWATCGTKEVFRLAWFKVFVAFMSKT